MAEGKIRVVMAIPALENHTKGYLTVSGMLRDAGMEVILLGNELPERVVETALQESADVIGISTYCGSPVVFGEDLLEAAEKKNIREKTIFIIGGIFPPEDVPNLIKMGFAGVFPPGPGSRREDIISCIRNAIASKKPN
ncbi:MAG TPA: methylmalonyl-CoA mutase [Desulfotomaculum sp.]|jgi:methylmalonyl-CoA mutase C-terminal domain/subunit|nr:methylmalonyl-CoA mutase [Desulfotomaculum sp.]